jgi:NADH-quinone oxidoreductase subunit N
MNWDFFQQCALDNRWAALMPEILLIVSAALLLMFSCFLPERQLEGLARRATAMTFLVVAAMIGWFWWVQDLVQAAWPTLSWGHMPQSFVTFSGSVFHTHYTPFLRMFFLAAGWLTVFLVGPSAHQKGFSKATFYPLSLWVIASFMLLVQAHHFLTFFLALESATVALYILIAYRKDSTLSLEAALKYLISGAVGSGILLMGIALLYGAATNPLLPCAVMDGLNFSSLNLFIAANPDNFLVWVGCAMILVTLGFKIGAVPFHLWIPDVYQGAYLPTTALLAVASKGAGVMILMNLLHGPFAALQARLLPVLLAIGIATILVGNTAALGQHFIKRILGLSGVAHAGYLILGVAASFYVSWAPIAILFYLFIYLIASFTTFTVISQVQSNTSEEALLSLHDFQSIGERNGFLGFALTSGLASLAGVPPFAGFVAKFLLLVAVFQAHFYVSFAAALVGVVVSLYYYFNWLRSGVFLPWQTKHTAPVAAIAVSPSIQFILMILVALSIVLGIVPCLV